MKRESEGADLRGGVTGERLGKIPFLEGATRKDFSI